MLVGVVRSIEVAYLIQVQPSALWYPLKLRPEPHMITAGVIYATKQKTLYVFRQASSNSEGSSMLANVMRWPCPRIGWALPGQAHVRQTARRSTSIDIIACDLLDSDEQTIKREAVGSCSEDRARRPRCWRRYVAFVLYMSLWPSNTTASFPCWTYD